MEQRYIPIPCFKVAAKIYSNKISIIPKTTRERRETISSFQTHNLNCVAPNRTVASGPVFFGSLQFKKNLVLKIQWNPNRLIFASFLHWRSHRPATPGGRPGSSPNCKRNLFYIYIKFYDFIVKYYCLMRIARASEIFWLRHFLVFSFCRILKNQEASQFC